MNHIPDFSWNSPFIRWYRAHSGAGIPNAFVAKLNSSGDFSWNTFLGGDGRNRIRNRPGQRRKCLCDRQHLQRVRISHSILYGQR